LGLALAGCAGDGAESGQTELPEAGGESTDDPPTSEPSSSPSEASPATGSPDDQPGELASEYPEAELRYELPEVDNPDAAILSERWTAQRDTREVSEELEAVASDDALASVEDGLEYQRQNGIHYVGEAVGTDVSVEQVGDRQAQVTLCYDTAEVALSVEGEGAGARRCRTS